MQINKLISNKHLSFALLLLVSFFSCQKEELNISDSTEESEINEESLSNAVNGIVRVKLTSDVINQLSVSLKSGTLKTDVTDIDSVMSTIGATSFERTFPYCKRFEQRTKEAGLDLWYDVKFDSTTTELATVLQKFSSLSEIKHIETIHKIKNTSVGKIKFNPSAFTKSLKSTRTSSYPFNDDYLSYQWQYNNTGNITDSKVGSDINLFKAWETQTGSEDVIVAVVDGGIDYTHPDLADNMWINPNESSDNTDDDNNGYNDDIYGYNFVDTTGTIVPQDHGTHVAGIIGARNNNTTGVCGIAGGDDTHVGVKLMSCQVFKTVISGNDTTEYSAENIEEAIKYAADNGAVICQCSWGYDGLTELPQSMQEAIDYFIANAGYDESGNQDGPMAGGIVFFAAGNDEKSTNAYPAMYDQVIAVGSCGADYTISSFSNFGSWIDIMAPGGEDNYTSIANNEYILSTCTVSDDGDYAFMIGTSQACPMVSGVAALILSQYGGTGFTPDDLKEKLYQGAIDLDSCNTNYSGLMGVGLINAAAALKDADNNSAPEAVADLSADASSNTITLSWTVPSDADDDTPEGYTIYYSTSDFTESDITNGSSSLSSITVKNDDNAEGNTLTYNIELDYSTTYYFKIAAYDILNKYSSYSSSVSATTKANTAPNSITDLLATASGNTVTLTWSVPSDNSGIPAGYLLYYSTSDFSATDIANGSTSLSYVNITAGNESVGEQVSYNLNLNYSTTYYFRIAAYDDYDAYSDYSSSASATTEELNTGI